MTHAPAMSDRLNLLQALDVVAFTRVEAGRYRVLGEVSAELATRFPALRAEQLTLAEDFALLDGCGSAIERGSLDRPQAPGVGRWRDSPQDIVEKELVQAGAPPYRMQDANRASWEGRRTTVHRRAGAS